MGVVNNSIWAILLFWAATHGAAFANSSNNLNRNSAISRNSSNSLGVKDLTLPTPKGLEKDVRFWEKIFSEISPNQCLFHDTWNLDVNYGIENVPRIGSRGRLKVIQAKKARIKAALTKFATGAKPSNSFERRVYSGVPVKIRGKVFFADAVNRVRCQRGVDLTPSLARSQKYLRLIRHELKKSNLPEDLAYLPHLESGFDVRAHSKAGARGIWQFTRVGAQFAGLRVPSSSKSRNRIDDRLDPNRSTKAAAAHLAEIFENTGCWPLAITAYNYGHNGVARAIAKFGPDYMSIRVNHKTRIFGFASRNYYPSFIAVRNVAKRYEEERRLSSRRQQTLASSDAAGTR